MQLKCPPLVCVVVLGNKYGSRYDPKEHYGGEYGMTSDQGMVLRQVSKAVAHPVVLHGGEVEAHEVG